MSSSALGSILGAIGSAISNAAKKSSSGKGTSGSSGKGTTGSSSSKGTSSGSSKGSSSGSSSSDYKNPYPHRETQYRWSDGTITYSNAENYVTAAREAGKDLNKTTLLGSTSYSKKNNPLGIGSGSSNAYEENNRINSTINKMNSPSGSSYLNYNNYNSSNLLDRIQGSDKYKLEGLQNAWNSTSNKQLKDIYNKEAEKIRQSYGIGSDGYGGNLYDLGTYTGGNDYMYDNPYNNYNMYDYEEYLNKMYDEMIDSTERNYDMNREMLLRQLDNMKGNVNRQYDEAANQAYINSMIDRTLLPELLAARGISGGAEESANLKLMTNYENAVNKNEIERISELVELENYINELIMKGEMEKAKVLQEIKMEKISDFVNYYENQNKLNFDQYKYQTERNDNYRQEANDWLQSLTENELKRQQEAAEYAAKLGDYSLMGELLGLPKDLTDAATDYYNEEKRLDLIRKRALANRK